MATPEKIVLVDGSAMIYRAFFAIPSRFTTKDGLHTNAIYGFTLMFKKLFSGRHPTHGAVVFDAPGKTHRDEMYAAYKAQRERMPDDLWVGTAWTTSKELGTTVMSRKRVVHTSEDWYHVVYSGGDAMYCTAERLTELLAFVERYANLQRVTAEVALTGPAMDD